jgi:transitional endoplasmic reticulum ATPase
MSAILNKAYVSYFKKPVKLPPCIIFLDEVDSVVPARGEGSTDSHVAERVLSQFLSEMDGLEELKGVFVMGATNRADLIDPAMLRPGRFDEIIELGLPDEDARKQILAVHLRNKPLSENIQVDEIAARCQRCRIGCGVQSCGFGSLAPCSSTMHRR